MAWPSAPRWEPHWARLIGWRASFLLLAGAGVVLAALAMWLLPAVRRIPDAPRPSLRKAIGQPGVKPVAIAWPLMLMAHFALFTFIAPFLREAGLPDYSITLSLTVLGFAGLVGIWIAGITVDMRPRRSLLITTAVIAAAFLLLPLGGTTVPGALVLMAVWGAAFGAIGIYNQSAILRAGKEYREAANGLTVLTIQLGITIGALYGAAALTTAGPLLVPVAAAVPVVVALVIMVTGRKHAYPPGPKEAGYVAAEQKTARAHTPDAPAANVAVGADCCGRVGPRVGHRGAAPPRDGAARCASRRRLGAAAGNSVYRMRPRKEWRQSAA